MTAVMQAIAAAMEAIEPDDKATAADVFCEVPLDVEDVGRDRAFQVAPRDLPIPTGRLVVGADSVTGSFDVRVAYLGQNASALTRLEEDTDRVRDALEGLEGDTGYPQILLANIREATVEYQGAGMIATFNLSVEWDPRDA